MSWPWCHKAGFARFAVCLWPGHAGGNSDLFDLRQNCEQDWDQGSAVMNLNGCKASRRAVFERSVSAITGMLPGCPSDKT